jgi:hypothetical protein
MSDLNPKSKSLASTVVQCELLQKAKYIHELLSGFPQMSNRDILADCISNPKSTALLEVAAADLQKFAQKLVKMHQAFEIQLADPLKVTGYEHLEVGQALSVHHTYVMS